MRTFSSYGPIDTKLHYYAPRQALLEQVVKHLVDENPERGGHYITVWAPRQTGKTWIMLQALFRMQDEGLNEWCDSVKINLQSLEGERHTLKVAGYISEQLGKHLNLSLPIATSFERGYHEALIQAARYGRELHLSDISLVFFVEYIDDENRQKYEVTYKENETGITVFPMFVETGK